MALLVSGFRPSLSVRVGSSGWSPTGVAFSGRHCRGADGDSRLPHPKRLMRRYFLLMATFALPLTAAAFNTESVCDRRSPSHCGPFINKYLYNSLLAGTTFGARGAANRNEQLDRQRIQRRQRRGRVDRWRGLQPNIGRQTGLGSRRSGRCSAAVRSLGRIARKGSSEHAAHTWRRTDDAKRGRCAGGDDRCTRRRLAKRANDVARNVCVLTWLHRLRGHPAADRAVHSACAKRANGEMGAQKVGEWAMPNASVIRLVSIELHPIVIDAADFWRLPAPRSWRHTVTSTKRAPGPPGSNLAASAHRAHLTEWHRTETAHSAGTLRAGWVSWCGPAGVRWGAPR